MKKEQKEAKCERPGTAQLIKIPEQRTEALQKLLGINLEKGRIRNDERSFGLKRLLPNKAHLGEGVDIAGEFCKAFRRKRI